MNMWLNTSAAALLVISGAAAASAQTDALPPTVHVGLFTYGADGTPIGAAYSDRTDAERSVVWTNRNGCRIGATSDRTPPGDATDAWRFSWTAVSATPEEAVIALDWQRTLDDGKPGNAVSGPQRLTLRAGEPVVLDSVVPSSIAGCARTTVSFEARYEANFAQTRIAALKAAGQIGTNARAGGGARVGGESGGAISGTGRAFGGGGVGTAAPAAGGAGHVSVGSTHRMFEVNLWLVHSVPGRNEAVLHQTLRASAHGAAYAFAPVAIETAEGRMLVQVTGSFSLTGNQLMFVTGRKVSFATSARPRDTTPDVQGTGKTVNAMPGPDEVLSFELPSVRLPGGRAIPDQFSVRVRIAPL